MTNLRIEGVRLIDLEVHEDDRGLFTEIFRAGDCADPFLQANRSTSRAGVLRGLHFHRYQADLWHVVRGRALAVMVDLRERRDPPRSASVELDGDVPQTLFIPPGVAHGFRALTDVELIYWVTREYDSSDEFGIAWNDPYLQLDWGPGDPILSRRDLHNERLKWDLIPEF